MQVTMVIFKRNRAFAAVMPTFLIGKQTQTLNLVGGRTTHITLYRNLLSGVFGFLYDMPSRQAQES